jgi:hypothetical protein
VAVNPGTFGYGTSVFAAAYNSSPLLTQKSPRLVSRPGRKQTITIGTSASWPTSPR